MFALPGRLHLNNKSELKKKKKLILQVVYIDSGLNVHLQDLLSCIDMPLKSNKHHPKGLSRFFPSFSCQRMDLQSGSSITAQHTTTARVEKTNTRWENGFCCRGMENKMLLMYVVKVKKRRTCKFTPFNTLQNSSHLQDITTFYSCDCTIISLIEENHYIIFIVFKCCLAWLRKEISSVCVSLSSPELRSVLLIVHTASLLSQLCCCDYTWIDHWVIHIYMLPRGPVSHVAAGIWFSPSSPSKKRKKKG